VDEDCGDRHFADCRRQRRLLKSHVHEPEIVIVWLLHLVRVVWSHGLCRGC
jgi:hypothetical protein